MILGGISIHALLAESDGNVGRLHSCADISIHALLAESDPERPCRTFRPANFYPRSPCGERRTTQRWLKYIRTISIHALLAESDTALGTTINHLLGFLSTLSLRRATQRRRLHCLRMGISIHALLAESDRPTLRPSWSGWYFYPRSPCGERPVVAGRLPRRVGISIHALLAESDIASNFEHTEPSGFLSTLSLRRATLRVTSSTRSHPDFYPRSPCGERPL